MKRLQAFARSQDVRFGIIIVGYRAESDALYVVDTAGMTALIADTFQTWDAMPDQIVFQSWVSTDTGQFITPSNLPEDRLYTHTNQVWGFVRRLRGGTGRNIGGAIPREP